MSCSAMEVAGQRPHRAALKIRWALPEKFDDIAEFFDDRHYAPHTFTRTVETLTALGVVALLRPAPRCESDAADRQARSRTP